MVNITEDTIREMWAVFNSHSASKFLDYFADDATWQDPMTPLQKGKQAGKQALEGFFSGFPDVTVIPRNIVVSEAPVGTIAVLKYRGHATLKGQLVVPGQAPIKATNQPVIWDGAIALVFNKNGKVASGVEVFDAEDFARQAGIPL